MTRQGILSHERSLKPYSSWSERVNIPWSERVKIRGGGGGHTRESRWAVGRSVGWGDSRGVIRARAVERSSGGAVERWSHAAGDVGVRRSRRRHASRVRGGFDDDDEDATRAYGVSALRRRVRRASTTRWIERADPGRARGAATRGRWWPSWDRAGAGRRRCWIVWRIKRRSRTRVTCASTERRGTSCSRD